MKRLIFFTLLLIAATAYITVKYFKNLNTSGVHAANVMQTIPADAALVFEFTNEKSFYDIYKDNDILGNLIGEQKLSELDTLKNVLFNNNLLRSFFNERNIYLSLYPSPGGETDVLLTSSSAAASDITDLDKLAKQTKTGMLITPLKAGEKKGYTIYFSSLKKRFYMLNVDGNIFAGSFSKDLVIQSANYRSNKEKHAFLLLPDQQSANSLANLYVNYQHLNPLFNHLFKANNPDLFKPFRMLPALAALNLNFKNNAVMFSGYSNIQHNLPGSYLTVFAHQQPVVNQLKDLFPSTTAYAVNMAVSNPGQFTTDLNDFHTKAGLKAEKSALVTKIKAETGINIQQEFNRLLANEFAVVTTRYNERIAIIAIKNGLKLRPFIINISNMLTDDIGQFNFNKLPYFLLGDAFSAFKRPYFKIIDNYLILANSIKEIESYDDSYINRKFISRSDNYINFDNLLAERSNISFFIHFKNAQQILKNELKDDVYRSYKNNVLSWKNFYAASYQLTATDHNYYTNLCMLYNMPDSLTTKKIN